MNMVEFYRKMDGLLNPSTTSKKVVDESAITVIQPSSSSYKSVRPNADSAAVNYANKVNDTEYEEYVYVEITDEENRVYQGAIAAGMEEFVGSNRSELNKQMTTVVDQYMEYICDLDYEEDGIALDANKISRVLNLLTGSVNDFTKEYYDNNKDKSAFIMADVTKEYIKFAEKKINEYAEQMQISEQNIQGLKDLDSNNLDDLKEIFNTITENGYATQHETKTAREATTDYIIAAMLNGADDIPVLKAVDPKYTINVNYTNAQKYAKEAERYENIGDYINAEKSYGKAYDAIAKMVAKVPITDLAAAVNYAGDSNAEEDTEIGVEEDTESVVPPSYNKPSATTPPANSNTTQSEKNQYEQTIEQLTNKIEQLESILKTLFEAITGVINNGTADKTEQTEESDKTEETDAEATMDNIMENMEDLKKLPASMSDFVTEMGYIYNKLVSADSESEAQAAFDEAEELYAQIQQRITEAEARLEKLKKIKERAEEIASDEEATPVEKQIAQSAASAYNAAETLVNSLKETLAVAEQMVKDTTNVLTAYKTDDQTAGTKPSTSQTTSTTSTTTKNESSSGSWSSGSSGGGYANTSPTVETTPSASSTPSTPAPTKTVTTTSTVTTTVTTSATGSTSSDRYAGHYDSSTDKPETPSGRDSGTTSTTSGGGRTGSSTGGRSSESVPSTSGGSSTAPRTSGGGGSRNIQRQYFMNSRYI